MINRDKTGHKTIINTTIISLETARIEGLKHYFTGKPCKNGHIVRRQTSTRSCTACARELDRIRYKINTPKEKLRSLNYQRRKLPKPTRPCPQTCELCSNPPKNRALHLDHDHETGKFRGWLCSICNTSIGKLGDTESSIIRVLDYLRGNKNGTS